MLVFRFGVGKAGGLTCSEALVKGEPQGARIALTLFRDKINELL